MSSPNIPLYQQFLNALVRLELRPRENQIKKKIPGAQALFSEISVIVEELKNYNKTLPNLETDELAKTIDTMMSYEILLNNALDHLKNYNDMVKLLNDRKPEELTMDQISQISEKIETGKVQQQEQSSQKNEQAGLEQQPVIIDLDLSDNIIRWNVNYNMIAPWKTVSEIIKSTSGTECGIIFLTEEIPVPSRSKIFQLRAILNVNNDRLLKGGPLVINIQILEQQKIRISYYLEVTLNTFEENKDYMQNLTNISSTVFENFGIYPSILVSLVTWLVPIIRSTYTLYSQEILKANKPSQSGGNNNAYRKYMKYKQKYLKLAKNTK